MKLYSICFCATARPGRPLCPGRAARPAGPPRDVEERAEGIERDSLDAGLCAMLGDLVLELGLWLVLGGASAGL
jgi:hypothetical protein